MERLTDNIFIPASLKDCHNAQTYNSASDLTCIEILFCDVCREEFNKACSDFSSNGASCVLNRDTDRLSTAIFSLGEIYYFVTFDEAEKQIRIVADADCRLPSINSCAVPSCTKTKFWQYEIDHSLIDCGMCYIFQCSDYSFFVIDSAHDYSVNDDRRIYEFMRERTPEGQKVRVAGWFISHGHIDHFGKFLDILRYNTEIEIEGLYFNFAPNDHPSSPEWMYSDINHVNIFYSELEKHPEIPVFRLHTGEQFYIGNLCIDVLCTHEDVYPAGLENYNDSSTVITVTVGENKICFPGDAGAEESAIVERRYPAFLNCDIMQIAHHGHFGTTPSFYRQAKAKTVLFPVTRIKYDEDYPRYEANRVADEIAEHNFIASDGTVEFTFPLEGSEIILYPDETFENFDGIFNLWSYEYTDEYKAQLLASFNSQKGGKIPY